ncbi:hypothetical protein RchiOBHm_Chr7g0235481 [Rosa chinensis]|uniref:Uncharacterized protein n=1 Tax=Rosa chinensis TaxID=74649 RepID=A0A2P6PGP1_ROSCH|nr:hypothetical protein RchiOBHm_Chr7g0235481 [Rosa chinensis]
MLMQNTRAVHQMIRSAHGEDRAVLVSILEGSLRTKRIRRTGEDQFLIVPEAKPNSFLSG